MLTMQQAFEKSARGLLSQMSKSRVRTHNNKEQCRYRGELGDKCAIGHLIDDEFYTPDIENLPSYAYYVRRALERSGVSIIGMADFLSDLQELHDKSEPVTWRASLMELANSYGLTWPDDL